MRRLLNRFVCLIGLLALVKTGEAQTYATTSEKSNALYITTATKDASVARRQSYNNPSASSLTISVTNATPVSYSIDGPTVVKKTSTQTYYLLPRGVQGAWWYVSCGTIDSYYDDMLTVTFPSNCSAATIKAFSPTDSLLAVINVSVIDGTDALSAGSIVTGSQSVEAYAIPATIYATPASGGNCNGGYQYQWQFSYDDIAFEDIDDATTDSLPFVGGVKATTYFRRKVTCGTDILYTGSVAVLYIPPFNPGKITSEIQSITTGTIPASLSATVATFGTCAAYEYQWQSSTDGYVFSNIIGAISQNLSFTVPLTVSSYYRRKSQCGSAVGFTNVIAVLIKSEPPLDARPPNEIDSLLTEGGIDIASIFNLIGDSIANSRTPSDLPLAAQDSIDEVNLRLYTISTGIGLIDSSLEASILSSPAVDSVETILNEVSEGGTGSNTALIETPFVDDNLIQLYRSTGDYAILDSITNMGAAVSFEEASFSIEQELNPSAPNSGSPSFAASRLNVTGMTPSAVVNGASLVTRGQIVHYTGSFYFATPNATGIRWIVYGGDIINQNTNPANGPLYADVLWRSSFGVPYVSLFDIQSNQYGTLPITFYGSTCRVFPTAQTVYYNQEPAFLMASNCATVAGATTTYQWQQLDVYSNTNWSDIPGATASTYQPAGLNKAWVMYRRVTKVYDNGGALLGSYPSSAASIKLKTVDAGQMNAAITDIQFNTSPVITQKAATGGYTASGSSYFYTWEYSVNNGDWLYLGNGEAFPVFPIQFSNTRIRRKVKISGLITDLYNLPSQYWEAVSNTINFTTFYQTVDYENKNYIRENIVLVRGINTWEGADGLTAEKKIQTTTYLDGLSRGIQVVGKGTHYDEANNQWYDMVQSITYEAGGRIDKSLLPYPSTESFGKFKNNTVTDQYNYYNTKFNDQNAFAKVEYDNSPLNIAKKSYSPGNGWTGTGVAVSGDIEPYDGNEGVRYWSIGFDDNEKPVSAKVYSNLSLLKTVGKDEKNKKVITYTNRSGHVILKKVQLLDDGQGLSLQHQGWLCTYYVYDDFGQLRYTITPKAVNELEANGWVVTQEIADELCYYYNYDELGRVIAKKTSGKGVEYVLYDKRNRPVFTQDANQRAKSPGEWLVSLYDELDRVVLTGLYQTTKTREQLQTDLNNQVDAITILNHPQTVGGTVVEDDLFVTQRAAGVTQYYARNSITFNEEFTSNANDEFSGETNPEAGPTTGGAVVNEAIIVYGSPIAQTELDNPAVFTKLAFSYYDNYDFPGAKPFDQNTALFSYIGGNVEDRAPTKRITGFPTGSKVRVLNSNSTSAQYLVSTVHYDEEGRAIQSFAENIKGGTDVANSQYHFDGRMLSTLETTNATGTDYNNFSILTKYKFDKIGRVTGVGKKINDNTRSFSSSTSLPGSSEDNDAGYKYLSNRSYNELNRLVKKVLSPNYNSGNGLETIEYDYNIRGWLTGINKNYALSEYTSSQWDHFFGIYLGYDNRDGKFSTAQYNGNLAGVIWKSQGDNTPRKFDYEYDHANRLTAARFQQIGNSGETWDNTKLDFSTKDISYDANGNILGLTHMGVLPGAAAPIMVDKLDYTYQVKSNKLLRVTDQGTAGLANGKQSDFKDWPNTGLDDYVYDANGNLTVDNNKNIGAIEYNYLDKPTLISINKPASEGGGLRGTIRYVYDAVGVKMQKIVTEQSVAAMGGQSVTTTTTYLNDFIFQKLTVGANAQPEALQMIMHEEGRIRVITPYVNAQDPSNEISGGIALLGGKQGVFDYFITDHLASVRAIITEEVNKASSVCTMEDANAAIQGYEEGIFGVTGANNQVSTTRFNRPDAWTSATYAPQTLNDNKRVSRLQATGNSPQIGPNVLLKVMAGDKISAKVDYYYLQNPGPDGNSLSVSALTNGLGGALTSTNVADLLQKQAGQITNSISLAPLVLDFFANPPPGSGGTNTNAPKAYLNYIFFDEQFAFVKEVSGFKRVTQAGNGAPAIVANEIKAIKNGYVYVYLSNESGEPVYFDNFAVSHERGRLIEDNHYYAYGLKIAGISSRALSTSLGQRDAVKLGYQGGFSEEVDEFELNYNEFMLRTYDPQIGRWTGIDPFDEYPSGYTGIGNNPANLTDPTGGFTGPGLMTIGGFWNGSFLSGVSSATLTLSSVISITSSTIAIGGVTLFRNLNGLNPNDGSSTRDNPNVIGIAAHSALARHFSTANFDLRGQIYFTEEFLIDINTGLTYRPDLIDNYNKNVWELKPETFDPRSRKGKYSNYVSAKKQIDFYVNLLNKGGAKDFQLKVGHYSVGGLFVEAPIPSIGLKLNGTVNGKQYTFTYYIRNPESGIIFYKAQPNLEQDDKEKEVKVEIKEKPKSGQVDGNGEVITATTVIALKKMATKLTKKYIIGGANIIRMGTIILQRAASVVPIFIPCVPCMEQMFQDPSDEFRKGG